MNRVFEETIEGVVRSDLCVIGKRLGGLSKSHKASVIFNIPLQCKDKLYKSLLEIASVTKYPENAKWRLWIDGVPITREYKPNNTLSLGDYEISTSIFDVTPIMKREQSGVRHRLTIVNEGSEPILILYSMLLKAFKIKGAYTKISYLSGGVSIAARESYSITPPLIDGGLKTVVRIPVYARRAPSILSLSYSGVEKRYAINNIVDEISIEIPAGDKITIVNESEDEALILPSLLSYCERRKQPYLKISSIETIREEGEVKARIKVSNIGGEKALNTQLIVIALGEPVYKKIIGELGAGEEYMDEIKVKVPKTVRTLTLRVVWRDMDETVLSEEKIRL